MEKEELLEEMQERLKSVDIDFNSLEKKIQDALLKIEPEIQRRFQKQKDALADLKKNKINIHTLSGAGVISNKTIYKYEVLVNYVKLCEEEYMSCMPDATGGSRELKEKLEQMKETIRKMDLHMVENEILQMEIDELKKSAKLDTEKIMTLSEENLRLANELRDIKKKHPELFQETKSTIIHFGGVTQ